MARAVEVTSSLGAGVLLLHRLTARDELGRLFRYEVEFCSLDPNIKLEDMLGTPLSIEANYEGGVQRYFHGFVSEFSQVAKSVPGYACYVAVLRPWFWFLTRTADCRIFQKKKVPEILKEVFDEAGFTDHKNSLTGTYREWENCVQYRESDFNFLSRLMEQEGFYYLFEHEKDKHTMVLIDAFGGHKKIAGTSTIPFRELDKQDVRGRESIYKWEVSQQVQPGTYVMDGFDFTRPRADLQAKSQVTREHAKADFEFFDYPGIYTQASEGTEYARARIEELQAQYKLIRGAGNTPGLAAGGLFELADYPRQDQNGEYLITSATYHIEASLELDTGAQLGVKPKCEFTAIESSQQYRTPRATPKPFIRGPQTAVVVGKKGEEIWTDEHGRIKVQFHWDRLGKSDEDSSCWIRVAQMWAGKSWGSIHLPRIGQEVVVEFLEGDPDRPIVTGGVYNGDNKVPYKLPDNQTQSGLQSRSTKKGDGKTFNELRFEDKKGSEEVYFHAEKDFVRIVENDDKLEVGLEKKDPGDQTVDIHNNRTVTLAEGNDSLTIKKGDQTIKVSVGKSTLHAAKSIELIVGGSSIKIEPSKITIKAPQIEIKGDAKLEAKSPATEVSGDGTLTLKGGMVKIN